MEPFLVVHYSKKRPLFAYAATFKAATDLVDQWLTSGRNSLTGSIAIVYTPVDRVLFHKRLNQPHRFITELLDWVYPTRQWFRQTESLTDGHFHLS